MRGIRSLCLLGALAVTIALVGCAKPPNKLKFNNALCRETILLGNAGKQFSATVTPLSTGQRVSANAVNTALANCEKELDNARKTAGLMRRPNRDALGVTMRDKFYLYLKAQQSIIDDCLKPIAQIVEDDENYPTAAAKWKQIEPLMKEAGEIEKDPYDALKDVHGKYLMERNLNVIAQPDDDAAKLAKDRPWWNR